MNDGAFHGRTLAWVVGLAVGSFTVGVVLAVFGPAIATPRSAGADSYSRSAVGFDGLVKALEALDVPVLVSRNASARKAARAGVLLLLAPRDTTGAESREVRLEDEVDRAGFALLVLPKWDVREDPRHRGWVSRVETKSTSEVEAVLASVGIQAQVRRAPPGRTGGAEGHLDVVPTFAPGAIVQTVEGHDLEPLVWTADGSVLARSNERPGLLVLSDPDLLSNAGLYRGDNLRFVLAALESARDGFDTVVVDETLHGYVESPSLWHELGRFPMVLVLLHLVLVLGVLLWAATGRFGSPRRVEPGLAPGTAFLVDRAAALLGQERLSGAAVERYLDGVLRRTARALGAPPGLVGPDLERWLDHVASSRMIEAGVGDLRAEIPHGRAHPHRALAAAARIHRWHEEILHGPGRRPNPA